MDGYARIVTGVQAVVAGLDLPPEMQGFVDEVRQRDDRMVERRRDELAFIHDAEMRRDAGGARAAEVDSGPRIGNSLNTSRRSSFRHWCRRMVLVKPPRRSQLTSVERYWNRACRARSQRRSVRSPGSADAPNRCSHIAESRVER